MCGSRNVFRSIRSEVQPTNPRTPTAAWSCAWSCASLARARPLARARLDLADLAALDVAVACFGGAAIVVDDEQGQLSCADGRKARGEQLERKARARRRRRREGAVRAAWRTRSVRRSELVRVAQLVLVLEVVDSVRARQVGGNVDALAKPVAVGRRQSEVNNAVLARQTRRQRAGSGRQRAGRAGAPVMPSECSVQHFDPEESRTCGIHCTLYTGYTGSSQPRASSEKGRGKWRTVRAPH